MVPRTHSRRPVCSPKDVMRDGITTAVSEGQIEAMRKSRESTWDDRGSLANAFEPTHPYGPTFQDLKPYQYARHPPECYSPVNAIAGRGWCLTREQKRLDDEKRALAERTAHAKYAGRHTDWGTRKESPALSNIDLRGGRDDPNEQGYVRGPVQQGPGTARTIPSLAILKPYSYSVPNRDFRNTPGFTTRAEAALAKPPVRGRAAGRTDWGTCSDGPVLSDADLQPINSKKRPHGVVQQGPATARTAPNLALLKPYNYGAPLRDFRNTMGFTSRSAVRV